MALQLLWKVDADSEEAVVLSTQTLNAMVSMLLGYQRISRKPPFKKAHAARHGAAIIMEGGC